MADPKSDHHDEEFRSEQTQMYRSAGFGVHFVMVNSSDPLLPSLKVRSVWRRPRYHPHSNGYAETGYGMGPIAGSNSGKCSFH